MSIVYQSEVNTIHRADAREVAATLEAGSFSLAVLDGPYAMQKAEWDRMKVADLPEWYAPHLDDVGRLCAASASLYIWNTPEGWAELHSGIQARGWSFKSLIVWDKIASGAMIGYRAMREWPDTTEVCGFYARGDHEMQVPPSVGTVWRLSQSQYRNERLYSGNMKPSKVGPGMERESLHPSQKPLSFADRILRASSRPGNRVWVPFGGTCREAVAAEWMARAEPDEARQVVTCEIDQDGRDYLGAVVRQLQGEDARRRDPRQTGLFG